MNAIKAELEAVGEAWTAKIHALWSKAVAAGDTVAEDIKSLYHEITGVAPKLEAEAEQDAADVVHTAETQGIAPAVAEAEHDGAQLAEDAAHDVAAAVEGAPKAEPETPSTTPAQSAAVIAGEAVVASEPSA